jgi:hypothetical protein
MQTAGDPMQGLASKRRRLAPRRPHPDIEYFFSQHELLGLNKSNDEIGSNGQDRGNEPRSPSLSCGASVLGIML